MNGLGKSSLTNKQQKAYHSEFAKLKTKAQKDRWFANGYVDAIQLSDLTTFEVWWEPMINGYRMTDKKGNQIKRPNREDALLDAIKLKKHLRKSLNLKN